MGHERRTRYAEETNAQAVVVARAEHKRERLAGGYSVSEIAGEGRQVSAIPSLIAATENVASR